MAIAEGARSTYDEPIGTGGNREDLSDILYDVSPTETPFLTAIKKDTATAVSHDWLTDALDDARDNAHIEGGDAEPVKAASRVRLSNYTQIFKKHAVVTGTQERVLKGGGIRSEMAYQVARRMKEIKRDAERAMVGVANAKEAGDEATPREMGSFQSYMTSDTFLGGVGATSPTGNGVDTGAAGTPRKIDEDLLKAGLSKLWDQSGGNENIMALCGSVVRSEMSNFTASSTRYVTTDDRKLVASIDVYDGDFHTVTITPDRFSDPTSLFLVDAEYAAIADLRPIFSKDLAVQGDSIRKQIVWEHTLKIGNPLAHIQIADLDLT